MNLLHTKRVFDYVSRHVICSVPLRERRVALTFDDGPNPTATPRLLKLLDARRVQATFFLIGRNVVRYPHLAAEIAARGHEIGNHTHSHLVLPLLPRRIMLRELEGASHLIHAATGHWPHLFRPPMGWFSRSMLRTLAQRGYRPILGDVHPQDSHKPGAGVIARRILERAKPGSIVILHDGGVLGRVDRHQSVDAAEAVIDHMHRRRYRFSTVSNLLERAQLESAAV